MRRSPNPPPHRSNVSANFTFPHSSQSTASWKPWRTFRDPQSRPSPSAASKTILLTSAQPSKTSSLYVLNADSIAISLKLTYRSQPATCHGENARMLRNVQMLQSICKNFAATFKLKAMSTIHRSTKYPVLRIQDVIRMCLIAGNLQGRCWTAVRW